MISSRAVNTGRIERNEEEARNIKNQEAEKKPAETRKNIPRYVERKERRKSLPWCGLCGQGESIKVFSVQPDTTVIK